MYTVRSLLATTDLSPSSAVVITAAHALSRRLRATLHVAHVRPHWDKDEDLRWQTAVTQQLRRCLGDERAAEVDATVVYDDEAYHGILVHAAAVDADLIVAGPPRGSAARMRVHSPTIERVVRAADVPCLIVRHPFERPVQHVAVATDLSPQARGASELAADWLPLWGHEATEHTLLCVGVDEARGGLQTEAAHLRPEERPVTIAMATGADLPAAVADWVDTHAADLLVVTNEGRRGWNRLWKGSLTTQITAQVACSVLWVPSTMWRRAPIPLHRIATLLEDPAVQDWVEERVARAQRPLEVFPAAPDAEPNDLVRRTGADLLIAHDVRRPRTSSSLATGLRQLLETTPVPVFVVRDVPGRHIQHLLVAVDTGELWYEKFGWARLFTDRFGADVTILHAVDLSPSGRVRVVPGGEFIPSRSVWLSYDVERSVVPAMQEWLWERVRLAGLPKDQVDVAVTLTDPWHAIPAMARRIDADLVIVGAHNGHEPGRVPLSTVARAVLKGGDYAVLAVVDRLRRARIEEDREAGVEVPRREDQGERVSNRAPSNAR